MNIEEAKNKRSDINVEGRIAEKGEARTVNTKYGETQVCDSYLEDESGRIKLTLWGEDIEKVKNGDTVSVQGAYTTTFRNEVQLNVPKKNGKLEVTSG
jgi:replication factor A1